MSGFKTHLSAGLIIGSGAGLWGWQQGLLSVDELIAAITVGSLAGLLPDLDADQGKPLTILFEILAVLLPSLALPWALQHLPGPSSVLAFVVVIYLLIRYGLFSLVQKMTVHRGNLHSIPFALIVGELTWLLFSSAQPKSPSLHNSAFVLAVIASSSALAHLLLDEIAAVGLRWGFIPRIKRSAGSAMKIGGSDLQGTILLYTAALLGALLLWFLGA